VRRNASSCATINDDLLDSIGCSSDVLVLPDADNEPSRIAEDLISPLVASADAVHLVAPPGGV
jgi:hypothetical protein